MSRLAPIKPSLPHAAPMPTLSGTAPKDVEFKRAEAAGLLGAPRAPTFNGPAEPPVLAQADAAPPEPVEEVAQRDTQHYAVQLIWNRGAIELEKIPVLAIFNGYLLYAVESESGPRRFCGVRLGFYADALSARLVAQYVRSEFKGVSVVPVSPREMTRASTAAIRLGGSRRGTSTSITRSRWPASPLSVDPANLRRAFTPGIG